jgi:3-oxoacyl-[acyl-carrier protein] reductase
MNDILLKIGASGRARRLLKTVGLPLSLPVVLDRESGASGESPLLGRVMVVGAPTTTGTSELAAFVGEILGGAGAEVRREPDGGTVDGLVFDASELASPLELRALFEFFQPLVGKLEKSGRSVILGRPPDQSGSASRAAAQSALEGFSRSLAKEIGKSGATAQLVRVASGAEPALTPLLRFLLSPRSAFVTGQVLTLDPVAEPTDWPLVQALRGKVALVTGAARGIGEATARALAAEGAHVTCLDRPEDSAVLNEVATRIGGSALALDLSAPESAPALAEALRVQHGGVDVVVHNAGVTRDKTLKRMTNAQWEQVIDVNLSAVLRVDQALTGLFRAGGREICLTSVAGIAGNVGQTNYAAAKAGLIGYVERRALDLGASKTTINAVAPGLIETRLTAAMPMVVREAGRRLSALGQGGQPADVAEAITFLASPGAGAINGRVLRVCGGAFLGA